MGGCGVGAEWDGAEGRRLWKFWSGDDVASLLWGGCHEFEAFQSVLLAEPEAGGSGAVVVP